MKKPLVSVDIDDVIADSTEGLRQVVNARTGHSLTKEQYKVRGEYWGYYEAVWKQAGIGHLIDFEALNGEMVEDQSHVKEMDQAHVVLSVLKSRYDFILITSRDESWKQATLAWLEERFSGIFNGLYFTGSRHTDSYKNKGQLCAELGVSIHIDDNVQHCESVVAQGIETILFGEYGWHDNIPDGLVHCKTWSDVQKHLKNGR